MKKTGESRFFVFLHDLAVFRAILRYFTLFMVYLKIFLYNLLTFAI